MGTRRDPGLRRAGISSALSCGVALCLPAAPAVQAQTILRSSSLSFGSFIAAGAGLVDMSASGQRVMRGRLVPQQVGTPASAAQVVLLGTRQAAFSVSLPGNHEARLSNDRGATMELRSFVSNLQCHGVFSPLGMATVSIGATLEVKNRQDSGVYGGTFSMTVNYE